MIHQSLCKAFICLILIDFFAKAAVIRRLLDCNSVGCLYHCLDWEWNGGHPILGSNPKFRVCHLDVPQFYSWAILPAPNGNIYICIQNTNLCLTLEYSVKYKRFEIQILKKNDEQYGTLQQWKYDKTFQKLANVRLPYCAKDALDLTMEPCNPNKDTQKIELIY